MDDMSLLCSLHCRINCMVFVHNRVEINDQIKTSKYSMWSNKNFKCCTRVYKNVVLSKQPGGNNHSNKSLVFDSASPMIWPSVNHIIALLLVHQEGAGIHWLGFLTLSPTLPYYQRILSSRHDPLFSLWEILHLYTWTGFGSHRD